MPRAPGSKWLEGQRPPVKDKPHTSTIVRYTHRILETRLRREYGKNFLEIYRDFMQSMQSGQPLKSYSFLDTVDILAYLIMSVEQGRGKEKCIKGELVYYRTGKREEYKIPLDLLNVNSLKEVN